MTAWSDDDLDREIDALLAVEPSPQFLATVRSRIAEPPRRARVPWVVPAFAGGAVLALLFVASRLWIPTPRPLLPAARIDAAMTAPLPTAAPIASASVAATRLAVTPRVAMEHRTPPVPVTAEVLVPRNEQESLQRVLRAAAQEPLQVAQAAPDAMHYPAEPPPLVVPAIVIEPLVPEDPAEGDLR